MSEINNGLNVWQFRSNHNRMIELQSGAARSSRDDVELAYFGSSAFRVTSPTGVSIMIDPWRNLPTRKWDWYFGDFPITAVDIGVSTHAHFDHDALNRLDAHVLLDRLIGTYEFADVRIIGIADKHATDSSAAIYDFKKIIETFSDVRISPPDNPRSWDNCLVVVECGGLRILHWGDNRPDPPDEIWDAIGHIDIALLPVDDTRHVMGFDRVQDIIGRVKPAIVVPHHYYIWNVTQRQSTLQTPESWLATQSDVKRLEAPTARYSPGTLPEPGPRVDYFGTHVAFDRTAWHAALRGAI
jgi:L-ascorbate metabolism protein UlaG (beta-lactamase superfamily)